MFGDWRTNDERQTSKNDITACDVTARTSDTTNNAFPPKYSLCWFPQWQHVGVHRSLRSCTCAINDLEFSTSYEFREHGSVFCFKSQRLNKRLFSSSSRQFDRSDAFFFDAPRTERWHRRVVCRRIWKVRRSWRRAMRQMISHSADLFQQWVLSETWDVRLWQLANHLKICKF